MPGADDAHSNNLLSRKSKSGGFRLGYPTDAENKNSEVEAHSNDLASYSESNNESLRGDHNYNNYNPYGVERNTSIGNEAKTPINNHKPSKRKAEDSKNISVVQSERNTGQDSRIVRVNRASGGKDRHSKVRTSKGLRDRRVRLSVSTAIQFYDLQDRLGCEQPSKAVDWLINAAKSAIDALPVLETETPGAVCKLSQTLASSNCSPANVSVLAPAGVFAATMGASSESAQNNQKGEEAVTAAQILNQASAALRQSEVGRFSSSSTSDGSIKGGDISNSSLPKSTSRGKDRFKEARERAKKKSASAKDPSGPYPQELNQMRSSFAELLNNVGSSNTHLPAQDKSQYSTRDHRHNPYGLPNLVSSSSSNIQQLWDTVSSYTDILCQDAVDHHEHQQQLHHMGSLCSPSHAVMQQPTPTSSSVAAVGTTYLRRHNGMGGSGMQLFDAHNPNPNPKQRHNRLEGNVVHFQAINLYSDPMRSFLKNNIDVSQGLLQHQHESQTVQKEFASTFNVPAFSNDVNFSTSCLSSRGALQSNSCSGPPDTPPLPINQKNPYGDDSTQLHFEVLQGDAHNFQGFDAQIPERFQLAFNFGESTKQEHSYIADPRRR